MAQVPIKIHADMKFKSEDGTEIFHINDIESHYYANENVVITTVYYSITDMFGKIKMQFSRDIQGFVEMYKDEIIQHVEFTT